MQPPPQAEKQANVLHLLLQAEIIQDPSLYVELDPDMAQSLIDMRQAGKTLMLITNSDFQYTGGGMGMSTCPLTACTLPAFPGWRKIWSCVTEFR